MLKNLERKRTVAWVKVRLQTTVPLLPGTMFRTVKTIETKIKKKKDTTNNTITCNETENEIETETEIELENNLENEPPEPENEPEINTTNNVTTGTTSTTDNTELENTPHEIDKRR